MSNLHLRMILVGVIGIFIGVLGTLGVWWYNANAGTYHGVEPYVVEGYCAGTDHDVTSMGISKEPGEAGLSYSLVGAAWREFGGPWHDQGSPSSLEWLSYGQKVRLGVIDYKPTKEAAGSSVVVWYEVIDVEHKVMR